MLSGELAQMLTDRNGIPNITARQQLSRINSPVLKLSGFFSRNQAFLFLEEHVKDGQYTKALKNVLKPSAKRVYCLILALEFHKGLLHIDRLPSYGFSPIANLKGHKRFNILLKDILRSNLITLDGDYVKLNDSYFPKSAINFQSHKAQSIAVDFVLKQFADWAKSTGFVSFDSTSTFHEYAKFIWCFTAPSYIGNLPTGSANGINPAFVIADVLIGKEINEDDVLFFVEKIETIKKLRGLGKVIPFLIVDYLPQETLGILKQNGIVIGFVNKLFGNGYSDLIKSLINTVSNAGAILKKNPDSFLKLMDDIRKLVDGKTNDLRGDVFELAVGYFHRHAKVLSIGKRIYVNYQPKELDIVANYGSNLTICECKGHKAMLTKTDVEEWAKKVILLRQWIEQVEEYKELPQIFELWSTGGFHEGAMSTIEALGRSKVYKMEFYDQKDMLAKARKSKDAKFVEILNQYFVSTPV
jgi:hypothetical protein